MSAGGSGEATGSISSVHLLILGIVGGLIGIYVAPYSTLFGSAIAGLGGVCAIVWGADAIRRVASYGLGTGVPSIGYMSLSIGIVGALAGIGIGYSFPQLEVAGPVIGLIFAMIIGLIVAVVAKKIVGMKIPILERCTMEIAGAAALSVLGFSVAITGTYDIEAVLEHVVGTGFIAVFFIMNTMAIQHPYNACLGPNEDQVRTLKCAASTAFLAMIITGILSVITGGVSWFIVLIIGLIGWVISFRAFVNASYGAAASVKWSGLWPKLEE
ncbi:tetrahydromethanopterin S-methyltransferase subunit C [Methanobrevibacter woesei]|uniref:Tetrahydromethanopterin S-methyltransferase subunit C n=1 Tax=Methanobrevibacter woesei TaxID=190976 RepID=A0A2U1S6V2_9EURY|nr:tetrahydromethanopterin S-methyltransferase subunit C [Methanobrevibacter woesei]MCC9260843.1 tetrahydromethanopterin S-methyltransferase subunit C [Methanobrevibacter woesei]PWB85820.1 tetrahydromethanopterin S-methyltransferase subunit C [Methanobrevibacter woesei]